MLFRSTISLHSAFEISEDEHWLALDWIKTGWLLYIWAVLNGELLERRHTLRCFGWERVTQRLLVEMHNTNIGSYQYATFGMSDSDSSQNPMSSERYFP